MSPAWLLPPKKVSPTQHGLRLVALLLATPAFYLVFTPATPHWQWLGQGLYALQALLWWCLLQPHRWPHANLRWWRSYGLEWTLMIGALLSILPPSQQSNEVEWILRLGYSALVFARLLLDLRFLLATHRIAHVIALALVCMLAAGLGFYWLEPTVHSYEEGLWLAFTSGATVGYGDIVPTTPAARLFAVFMVLIGFTLLSVFTATLAALLIGEDEKKLQHELHQNMRSLHTEIAALRQEISLLRSPDSARTEGEPTKPSTMTENLKGDTLEKH